MMKYWLATGYLPTARWSRGMEREMERSDIPA